MKPIINLTSITNYLQTKYSINEVISSLDKISTELFKDKKPINEILQQDVPYPLSEDLKKLAKEHEANIEDDLEADKFFSEVRKAILRLPILTVTTGLPPTLELTKEVNSWVLANIKDLVAIDFEVDRSLIAGAVIRFNGKSRDYSVKKETLGVATIENTKIN